MYLPQGQITRTLLASKVYSPLKPATTSTSSGLGVAGKVAIAAALAIGAVVVVRRMRRRR